MKSKEVERTWPAELLHPVLDSLVQPHGAAFFIQGQSGQGKTTFLHDLRTAVCTSGPGHPLAGSSSAMRLSRLKLGDRRYLACPVSLSSWSSFPLVPLQGILAAELSVSVPRFGLPLSSGFFTRGEFSEALASGGYEGLVVLADDLDRLLVDSSRPTLMDDLAFLDDLASIMSIYLLPMWIFFTMSGPLEAALQHDPSGGRLRHRFTHLHLRRS